MKSEEARLSLERAAQIGLMTRNLKETITNPCRQCGQDFYSRLDHDICDTCWTNREDREEDIDLHSFTTDTRLTIRTTNEHQLAMMAGPSLPVSATDWPPCDGDCFPPCDFCSWAAQEELRSLYLSEQWGVEAIAEDFGPWPQDYQEEIA